VKRDADGNLLERIDYIDVCSLYPYSNKYGEYPVGHPKIVLKDFELIDKHHHPYDGIIFCSISPPGTLLHPLLPNKCRGKLLFHLCATCAKTRQQQQCQHSDDERVITGMWVSLELYKALELGYKVIG